MKRFFCMMVFPVVALAAGMVPDEWSVFAAANNAPWQEVFYDACTGDWNEKWFLDGEVGSVETSAEGMQLTAGPRFGDNAHHMVLWTKESFEGDLKIEFDFTRLDFETRCVNILYIQATGSGKGPYAKDISVWNELRKVPAMKMYFNHMNLYHISLAAFPNDEDVTQYIRGRRYLPEAGKGLEGTDFTPDYFPEGLFDPGVKHHVTVIKRGTELLMRIQNDSQVFYCRMSAPGLPPVTEGRIGLRHMFTRSARYQNLRISRLQGSLL